MKSKAIVAAAVWLFVAAAPVLAAEKALTPQEITGQFIAVVKAGTFPGKTVIFPHIEDLPLTALPDLHKILPNVAEKLQDGRFWTKEAEEELLREKLD